MTKQSSTTSRIQVKTETTAVCNAGKTPGTTYRGFAKLLPTGYRFQLQRAGCFVLPTVRVAGLMLAKVTPHSGPVRFTVSQKRGRCVRLARRRLLANIVTARAFNNGRFQYTGVAGGGRGLWPPPNF